MKTFLIIKPFIHKALYDKTCIENTIFSIIKCIENNYPIELDIHILRDNNIVVYHDYNLKRLTGINRIIETLDIKELSKLKIKNKYSIPTLIKVLNIVNGKVPLLIEIKDLNNNIVFINELVKILDKYKGDFALASFNPFVINWFLKNKPNYILGIFIYNEFNYNILKKYIKKINFIGVNKKNLPFKTNKKVKIIGWTIKSSKEYKKYKDICDNIICEKIL